MYIFLFLPIQRYKRVFRISKIAKIRAYYYVPDPARILKTARQYTPKNIRIMNQRGITLEL